MIVLHANSTGFLLAAAPSGE